MTKLSTFAGAATIAAALASGALAQPMEKARLDCLLDPVQKTPDVKQGPPGTQTLSIRNASFRALQPGLVTIKITSADEGCCKTRTYMSKDAVVAKQSMVVGAAFKATSCTATIAEKAGPGK